MNYHLRLASNLVATAIIYACMSFILTSTILYTCIFATASMCIIQYLLAKQKNPLPYIAATITSIVLLYFAIQLYAPSIIILHYVSPLIACIFTYIMTSLTHANVQPVHSNTTIPEIYICALEIIVFSILLILTQGNPFSALVIMGLHIYNHSMYEFENYKKPGIIITLLFTLVFASLYAPGLTFILASNAPFVVNIWFSTAFVALNILLSRTTIRILSPPDPSQLVYLSDDSSSLSSLAIAESSSPNSTLSSLDIAESPERRRSKSDEDITRSMSSIAKVRSSSLNSTLSSLAIAGSPKRPRSNSYEDNTRSMSSIAKVRSPNKSTGSMSPINPLVVSTASVSPIATVGDAASNQSTSPMAVEPYSPNISCNLSGAFDEAKHMTEHENQDGWPLLSMFKNKPAPAYRITGEIDASIESTDSDDVIEFRPK